MRRRHQSRRLITFLLLAGLAAIAIFVFAWRFSLIGIDLWRVYLASNAIQSLGGKYVSRRPAGLPKNLRNGKVSLTRLLGDDVDKDKISLLISKSQYKLTVYYDGRPIKDYMTVYGGDPIRDKQREGDKRTPEGDFAVQDLYPHNIWSKFIWVSYPTDESWRKHKDAISKKEIPEGADIGGEIGIHGTPKGDEELVMEGINWTAGCISVTRHDVDELYSVLQVGTPIKIRH